MRAVQDRAGVPGAILISWNQIKIVNVEVEVNAPGKGLLQEFAQAF
jgi:hypothetical protein